MKTTIKQLEATVERINKISGSPLAAYSKNSAGKFVANPGNYHLDGAYGGYALCRMSNTGGGTSDVFQCGHISKLKLAEKIQDFICGFEAATN